MSAAASAGRRRSALRHAWQRAARSLESIQNGLAGEHRAQSWTLLQPGGCVTQSVHAKPQEHLCSERGSCSSFNLVMACVCALQHARKGRHVAAQQRAAGGPRLPHPGRRALAGSCTPCRYTTDGSDRRSGSHLTAADSCHAQSTMGSQHAALHVVYATAYPDLAFC